MFKVLGLALAGALSTAEAQAYYEETQLKEDADAKVFKAAKKASAANYEKEFKAREALMKAYKAEAAAAVKQAAEDKKSKKLAGDAKTAKKAKETADAEAKKLQAELGKLKKGDKGYAKAEEASKAADAAAKTAGEKAKAAEKAAKEQKAAATKAAEPVAAAKKTAQEEAAKLKTKIAGVGAGNALPALTKRVVDDQSPLFAQVTLWSGATEAAFTSFEKVLAAEQKFWEEAEGDAGKKGAEKPNVAAAAKKFASDTKTFGKACAAMQKQVKAGKAADGKAAFSDAVHAYYVEALKDTALTGKALAEYEKDAKKKATILGYVSGYVGEAAAAKTAAAKAKEAAAGGSLTWLWVLLALGAVGGAGFAVWWCKFRKAE